MRFTEVIRRARTVTCGLVVSATSAQHGDTCMPEENLHPSQKRLVGGYAGNLGTHAVSASVGLLDAGTAANAFFLAQHEFRELAAPADWRLLQRLGALAYVNSAI